jgi:mono/diheme cytochrome c family protein
MVRANSILSKVLLTALAASALAGTPGPSSAPRQRAGTPGAAGGAGAVLKQYCVSCHNDQAQTAGLSLSRLDPARVQENPAVWEKVVRKLRTGTMPPPGSPRPELAAYDLTASWLETELDRTAQPNPGRPALRRLNRAEYGNAIRDLLDLRVDVESLLLPDDAAFGFDNIGDLLEVSPSLLERYLTAADRVSALAVGDPATPAGSQTYSARGDQSQDLHREGMPLGTVGGLRARHTFPLSGEYEFRVSLLRNNLEGIRGLEHPHQLEISVDGERLLMETVGGEIESGRPGTTITERSDATDARLRVRVAIQAGPREVAATFLRKLGEGTTRLRPFDRSNADTYESTGRPHVETLTVTGPFQPVSAGDTPSRRRIFICRPAGQSEEEPCARRILSALAGRAYRRPAIAADLDLLLPFYRDGRRKGGFETGIQLALRRLLASPTFVFRAESDPGGRAAARISDIELASRLSFFLWSSIPDDTLISLASRDRLRQPGVLESELRRMLADPRSDAMAENFAGQWLHLRNLENINPNTDEFPDFDNDLRSAFVRESELFFASVMREDRSVMDLLTADYTFANERLARHYGIPGVYGSRFRRVTLGPEFDARRGLLGKGGVLMSTSRADRTSPVLRGKWILENLIGTAPPPPPANVPPLETRPGAAPRTIRERMAAHRAPGCVSCHQLIDPLGFALEEFDAVGAWRTHEAGAPVDASSRLTDGRAVNGVSQLRAALAERPEAFVQAVTERLLIYALGRGLQYYDMPVVRAIVRDAKARNYSFNSVLLGIVRSVPFQQRAGSGATPAAATAN